MYSEQPTSGNAYTDHAEYYGFVGEPRKVIIYDWTIRRYRYAVMQPLSTAQDRVVAPCVEPVDVGEHYGTGSPIADKLEEAMTSWGPLSPAELAERTGSKRDSVHAALARNRDRFVRLSGGQGQSNTVWGLVGVHDGGTA